MKNLKELNINELKKLASKKNIGGRSKMNKDELIKNLNNLNKMKGGDNNNINRTKYKGKYLNLNDIDKIMKEIKSGNGNYFYGSIFNPDFYEKIMDMNFVRIENENFFVGKNNKGENIIEKKNSKRILQFTLSGNYIIAPNENNLYLIDNVIYEISDIMENSNVNGRNRNLGQENINKIENKHKNKNY